MPTVHGYTTLPLPFSWEDWLPLLAQHLGRSVASIEVEGLRVEDFPPGLVDIRFSDGSSARFKWAFMLVRLEQNLCCVFTCYSGTHVLQCSRIERASWRTSPRGRAVPVLREYEWQNWSGKQDEAKRQETKAARDTEKWQHAKKRQQSKQVARVRRSREG